MLCSLGYGTRVSAESKTGSVSAARGRLNTHNATLMWLSSGIHCSKVGTCSEVLFLTASGTERSWRLRFRGAGE
jgi:hypothetical protein